VTCWGRLFQVWATATAYREGLITDVVCGLWFLMLLNFLLMNCSSLFYLFIFILWLQLVFLCISSRICTPCASFCYITARDHSLMRNAEFWAELWNLFVSTQFVRFCWILQNSDECGIFWSGSSGHRKLITICRYDFALKYMTATPALMGGILKTLIIEFMWNVGSLFGEQTVSVSCGYRRQIMHIWLGLASLEN